MRVYVPTPLRSYTGQQADVEADLDRRYPGMRFRMIDEQDAIRPHVRIFVNGEQVGGLEAPLRPWDEVQILQALSGG